MLLLELAAQSVRGFSPTARVALKPGYLVLKSPTEQPAPFSGVLSALCFPDGRGGDAAYLAPGAKTGKVGFSFQGNDSTAWRLVRDLGGAGSLHKLNRANNQFEVVTQESNEIAQMIRAAVGMPPRTTFEQIFVFQANQLPTRRPKGKPATGGGAEKAKPRVLSSAPISEPEESGLSPTDAKARLAELAKELAISKQVTEIQFRQDGLQAELFKLEAKVKAYDDARAAAEGAQAAVANVPTLESLGLAADILEKVNRYPAEVQRKEDALTRLGEERSAAEAASSTANVMPISRDQRFLASLGLGLALLAAGILLEGVGRYLAMLAIPGFTFAGLLALRHVEDLQANARQSNRYDFFGTREKKINDEFAFFAGQVKAAFKAANVESAEEFHAVFGRKAELEERAAQAAAALAELEADPETRAAVSQGAKLKAEQEKITAQLLEMSGGYIRDVKEIEREIAKVKGSGGPRAAAPPPPAPKAEEFAPVSTDPSETFDDPVPALMLLGADLFNTDLPSLWAVLKDRTGQYLTALSDRRLHGVDVTKDGKATVLAPGRSVPAGELPGKDLDLVYLSIRLTLIEKYSAQGKVPVIFEDGFKGALEDTKLPLLVRMLKHLATLTQVLHVAPASHAAAPTDAVLAL